MQRYEIHGPLTENELNKINQNYITLFNEYRKAGLNAAEAREKALQAVTDAEIAKETAEVTRKEMHAIIREQTQNKDLAPEITQARQGYGTLGENLNSIKTQLLQKAELKIFTKVPGPDQLEENELGLVLLPEEPFNYDFTGTSGLSWDVRKFETKKHEATSGLMDKENSYAQIKDNRGLIKAAKNANTGLAVVENKAILDLDFTYNKKYRIRFDVLRSVVKGANWGNCGISISPLDTPSTYYPFDYSLSDGIGFIFGRNSAKGTDVTINFRKIIGGSYKVNSSVAESGGLSTTGTELLALKEGEFHHIDLIISTDSLRLTIDGVEYLNSQEDLSVLNSSVNKIVFWGMVHDANALEAEHYFDNVLIEEVV